MRRAPPRRCHGHCGRRYKRCSGQRRAHRRSWSRDCPPEPASQRCSWCRCSTGLAPWLAPARTGSCAAVQRAAGGPGPGRQPGRAADGGLVTGDGRPGGTERRGQVRLERLQLTGSGDLGWLSTELTAARYATSRPITCLASAARHQPRPPRVIAGSAPRRAFHAPRGSVDRRPPAALSSRARRIESDSGVSGYEGEANDREDIGQCRSL